MTRKLSLLALLAATASLVWGSARLQGIFVEERDAALTGIAAKRRALEQYAAVALERRLHAAYDQARPRIDAALADPLLPDEGLLMVDDGKQLLPRPVSYADGSDTPASRYYAAAMEGAAAEEGPSGERLALLGALDEAIRSADGASITDTVRGTLNHLSRYVIPLAQDLPLRVLLLERLVRGTTPDRELLAALLRDGLRGTRGRRIEGLQPMLLASRERFTQADFTFLADKVTALCRDARVVHDDFDVVARKTERPAIPVPAEVLEPMLVAGGTWYVAPIEAKAVRGVAVDVEAMLRDVAAEMKKGSLLEPDDAVLPEGVAGDVRASAFPIRVRSAAFAAEAARIDGRHAVKTATGIALAVLVACVAGLTFLLYRRERKYVEGRARFVATVSHELRTPIASLRLMGETLERRLGGVESAKDFPSRIVAETERLSFLVENILSYNRLEKASVEPHRQNVTLAELVDAVSPDTAAFTTKPVHVHIEDGAEVALRVDMELAKLLLSNLVHNSCKYNVRDSVEVHLTALATAQGIVIRISDNGSGIPREDWESIFDEFVRSRTSAKTSGFGLGLALCRRIIELHDGTIRVTESSSAGTTFEMTFPDKQGQR